MTQGKLERTKETKQKKKETERKTLRRQYRIKDVKKKEIKK